jgi:hypothetical protein
VSQRDRDYYAEERAACPDLEKYTLTWHAVVELAERCRKALGEAPITYILKPQDKGYHRANQGERIIEFTGHTNPMDVAHEVAHMLFMEHDKNHAFVTLWLACMIKDHYLATPLTLTPPTEP